MEEDGVRLFFFLKKKELMQEVRGEKQEAFGWAQQYSSENQLGHFIATRLSA